jgi:hypothetical protein
VGAPKQFLIWMTLGSGDEMSIRDRVEDALLLWKHGHHEGGLLNILVAIAASARKQYPRPCTDCDSFVTFLEPRIVKASHVSIEGIQFRDEMLTPAKLFYTWFRCQLVHEGELPIDTEFIDKGNSLLVKAGGGPRPPLQISHAWFWVLVATVSEADERGGDQTGDGFTPAPRWAGRQ